MQPNRGTAAPRTAAAAAQAQVAGSLAGAVDLAAIRARTEAAERAAAAPAREGGSYVIDVTESTFQAEVIDRSFQVPVILDLWAEWCQPCKQLSPVLERLAAEGNGAWILAKVDIDTNPRLAEGLQVQSIPAVKAVLQGALAAEFNGALPESEVRKFLAAVVEAAGGRLPAGAGGQDGGEGGPQVYADARLDAAEDAVGRGDLDAAEAAYAEILAAEPGHPIAGLALSQVRLLRRAEAAGPDAVAQADADPRNPAAARSAADVELAQGQVERAFDRLLTVIRATSGDDRDSAREGLLELFALVGDDDPRVLDARKKLTAALF
ncbi:MAG: tetratricopeptide repeat protein [Actinomycetota bacterium]|nr:tetratricopeptide repeat protein [Actinomycetota bacterium]